MAQLVTNFKNFLFKQSSVPVPVLETVLENSIISGTTYMIIGLDICNILNTGITVDMVIERGVNSYHLLKNTPIPVGATLQVISKQKHVLEAGDIIKIKASLASAVEITGSYMDVYVE